MLKDKRVTEELKMLHSKYLLFSILIILTVMLPLSAKGTICSSFVQHEKIKPNQNVKPHHQ